MDHSGDGWAIQANGHRFWGIEGAAGLMLRAPGPDGLPLVLMQYRSGWTSMPFTWGVPGGARDLDETVEQAALREAAEETGIREDQVHIIQSQITARFSVDYGVRRAAAVLWPQLPSFTTPNGSSWVGFLDPSVTSWTYTTVSAFAEYPLELEKNEESIDLRWWPESKLEELDLMAPFRDALPLTRCTLKRAPVDKPFLEPGPEGRGPVWVMPE